MRLGANPHPPGSDAFFMYEALRLAHRGLGWTSPNPAVGCVIVRDGEILGRGWHSRCGAVHAEVAALADAGDARGATVYSTLEPCSHVGQQPACTSALVDAGVARVVFGAHDTDSRTAGKAEAILGIAGVGVSTGVLREDCARMLLPYLFHKREQRPHVHLKLALSLDGKMACANGASQWLSGPQSLGLAHYLRQQYDAVMVGRGTLVADNPRLTVRAEVLREYMDIEDLTLRDPVRILVDPGLESWAGIDWLNIMQAGNQRADLPKILVVTTHEALAEFGSTDSLNPRIVFVAAEKSAESSIAFDDALKQFSGIGITSVLVEGGARLAAEIIKQNAADHATLVYTPLLLGSDALGFTPQLGLTSLLEAPHAQLESVTKLGDDVAVSVRLR